jgi:hypothetical protein
MSKADSLMRKMHAEDKFEFIASFSTNPTLVISNDDNCVDWSLIKPKGLDMLTRVERNGIHSYILYADPNIPFQFFNLSGDDARYMEYMTVLQDGMESFYKDEYGLDVSKFSQNYKRFRGNYYSKTKGRRPSRVQSNDLFFRGGKIGGFSYDPYTNEKHSMHTLMVAHKFPEDRMDSFLKPRREPESTQKDFLISINDEPDVYIDPVEYNIKLVKYMANYLGKEVESIEELPYPNNPENPNKLVEE